MGRVSLGNPWVNICTSEQEKNMPISKEEALEYTTSLGLALRGANYENN